MKLLFSSLFLVSLSDASVTVCPKAGSIGEGMKYHSDTQCDRAVYDGFKSSLGRYQAITAFKEAGGVSTVPNERTVKCPANGAAVNMREEHQPHRGLDTVFFVENAASTPIVMSYRDSTTGIEVSAKDPKISPAIADPTAILAPGRWMAVYAFEGHEFVARQVLKSGAAGNVLMQHRAGLIPVGLHAQNLACPVADVEPLVNNTRAAPFARTPPTVHRPCNTMDIGFRNVASCPLHGYYVSGEGESCREDFKFHLGVEQSVEGGHFMWDWQSATKYEGTFVGHSFHFRLASNPAVLVDTVTLSPVVVMDCPTTKTAVPLTVGGEAVVDTIGNMDGTGSPPSNLTEDFQFLAGANSTLHHAAAHYTM